MTTKLRFDCNLSSFEEEFVFRFDFLFTVVFLFCVGLALNLDQGIPYSKKLLGNDRQYFDVNTVKLIETCPTALLTQAREQLTDKLVINLV
jgi:hypothetical protein